MLGLVLAFGFRWFMLVAKGDWALGSAEGAGGGSSN